MREKLTARLQIPLAIMAALLGFLAFMLRNKEPSINDTSFWVLFSSSSILIAISIICFIISWYSYKYKLLPTSKATDDYRNELKEFYKEYDEADELVEKYLKEYLFNYYRDFSSVNMLINDKKAFYLYLTNVFLIFSIILSFATFLPFYFEKLDKSYYTKSQRVIIESPIEIKRTEFTAVQIQQLKKELNMTKKQPPPPPPPPPARNVRGTFIGDKAAPKPAPKPPSDKK